MPGRTVDTPELWECTLSESRPSLLSIVVSVLARLFRRYRRSESSHPHLGIRPGHSTPWGSGDWFMRQRHFQAPFAFFFRSAHHFRFASLRRFRTAALIRRRVDFSVFRTLLRPCRGAVVPSRAPMAWLRRSRSAFSSARILSSVKVGSSHSVVGLMHTKHSLSPRPIGISDGG